MTEDMKDYWEKKKVDFKLDVLKQKYKEKIFLKMSKLEELEMEWKKTYFDLISKEDMIKVEEKELKKILKEFSDSCKEEKRGNDLVKVLKSENKKNATRKKRKKE